LKGRLVVSSLLDFSDTEKPRRIQENLMAYMRLFAGLPGTMLYDAESFWFVSSKLAPGVNLEIPWTEFCRIM
jgi:hypothetical protein